MSKTIALSLRSFPVFPFRVNRVKALICFRAKIYVKSLFNESDFTPSKRVIILETFKECILTL